MSDTVRLLEVVKQAAILRVQNIHPSVIDLEMRWVVEEFLSATRLWRRNVTVVTAVGITDYALPIEDHESVTVLMDGSMGTTYPGLRLGIWLPEYSFDKGPARAVGMIDDRTVRVYPTPNVIENLWLDVALTLLPTFESVPPSTMRPYFQALLDGLLARLYAIPDKPWTNFKLVSPHLTKFESAKVSVRREIEMGRVKGPLFAQFPVI